MKNSKCTVRYAYPNFLVFFFSQIRSGNILKMIILKILCRCKTNFFAEGKKMEQCTIYSSLKSSL